MSKEDLNLNEESVQDEVSTNTSNKETVAELEAALASELNQLRAVNKQKIQKLEEKQKSDLLAAKAANKSKAEIYKLKNDQWIVYQQYVQDLQYEEYLQELENKKEIDKAKGIVYDENADADVEQGNPVVLYFKHLFRDLKVSFTEKPSLIFGLLLCVAGIIVGFEINKFIGTANGFPDEMSYVGAIFFIYELVAMLNMVNGIGMCTERRLKTAVKSCICTVLLLALTVAWIVATKDARYTPNADTTNSIIIMSICTITSIAGTVGAFFTYDKHYIKVIR
jgi:hypothetical protein